MGIDIYLRWKGMTKKDRKNQITGWDPTKGDAGYLREAYHGGPYATDYLVKEAFEEGIDEIHIPAKELRKRLPLAIDIVIQRAHRSIKKTSQRTMTGFNPSLSLWN